MYHQGVSDAHPRPLCPVAIRPDHYVAEIEPDGDRLTGRSRRLQRRAAGFLGYNVHLGSRLPVRGAVLMTAFGWLALVPLVLRVVFPWLSSRWSRVQETSITAVRTRLQLDREDDSAAHREAFRVHRAGDGGYRAARPRRHRDSRSPLAARARHRPRIDQPQQPSRVGPRLRRVRGRTRRAERPRLRADGQRPARAPAAGRRGAVHRRDHLVRRRPAQHLRQRGHVLRRGSHPRGCQPLFERAVEAIETARRREAHERCRRFDAVPRWYPPLAALAHVQGRAADLAQPRPEYGHATNAFCIIGRRTRTRGLFLDRRAFLVSYDPTRDDDGAILARIMAAVVPVVAGISLEYYFSYVDPTGYGCGTKLPHNVTSLLGVMDGAQSDLRTGLPWQMVEIHEPTRLAIVVEGTSGSRVGASCRATRTSNGSCETAGSGSPASMRSPAPCGSSGRRASSAHTPEHALAVVAGESAAWYQGKRGFLPPVAIVPGPRPRPTGASRGRPSA